MSYTLTDYRIDKEEIKSLNKLGFEVLKCPPSSILYDAICGHPDILLHLLDNENIIVHKDMDTDFINKLEGINKNVIFSKDSLKETYPYDIILNALNLSNLFVHNTKYTDEILLGKVIKKKIINVKQGYTKCSTAIVSDTAVMTSDSSIYKALIKENIDVLLLPCGDIVLPGLNYGFIGGCCGLLNQNTLAFYGDLNCYAYGKEVMNFLDKHNVKPVFLRHGKLIDRGSLFTID